VTGKPPARARIYLVRHGETDWNVEERLLSFTDMPLNARGEDQARTPGEELAAEGIGFDHVRCSPRVRATRSAELILGRLPGSPAPVLDDRLVEVDFGPLEGRTAEELAADPGAVAWRAGAPYPGVETGEQVESRARAAWADLPVEGTTFLVAHGRFLRNLIGICVLDLPAGAAAADRMRMRNCRPAVVEPGRVPLILSLNAGPPYRQ